MSKQLAAAMAPKQASLQQPHAHSALLLDSAAHMSSSTPVAPSAIPPPPVLTSAKASGKKAKAIKAKIGRAHSTAGMQHPAANTFGAPLPQWDSPGTALLDNYQRSSLPMTTATAMGSPAAFQNNSSSPTCNAFSWLHQPSLQQPALATSVPLGSAPAILSSLAGYGISPSKALGMGPGPGTALGHSRAAGAFPTAALGTATTLKATPAIGTAPTFGTASALGSALGSGPAHAALELSLLLTTLQSLSGGQYQAEGGNAPHSTLAINCHLAVVQLREWLSQLQHQALPSIELVSSRPVCENILFCPVSFVWCKLWIDLDCMQMQSSSNQMGMTGSACLFCQPITAEPLLAYVMTPLHCMECRRPFRMLSWPKCHLRQFAMFKHFPCQL